MPTDPSAEGAARQLLPAHSLAEAYLYVTVQHCPECGQGPLKVRGTISEQIDGKPCLTMPTRCGSCGQVRELLFRVLEEDDDTPAEPAETARRLINATDWPSEIIDVAEWLTLYRMNASAAERAANRMERLELQIEAAQCLEEALKFYEPDSELPPEEAFFSPRTRRRLRDHPEQYLRQSLVDKLAGLPRAQASREEAPGARVGPKRWWQWWR